MKLEYIFEPCFCGAETQSLDTFDAGPNFITDGNGHYKVQCLTCGACTSYFDTHKDAATEWNETIKSNS